MRRIIVLPYLRVMVIANIVIDSSSIVIANQIFTKDPYWRKLEMFRIGMGYIRYSSVLHWCLDEEKCKKSFALRTQSQGCHRTCCVIKYVFILGLHYWTNWTKNKMKSTNFTRGKGNILKLEDCFRHFNKYRCKKKDFSLFNSTQVNFFALTTLLGGRCQKGSPCCLKSKCSCLKLFPW